MTDRIPALTADEAAARLDADGVVLDVREADEWHAGHVDGSTWIPMNDLSARQGELPEGKHLVVVCHSGGRSARVTQALVAAGYDASNLVGGLLAWAESGRPLVTDDGSPGTV